MYTLVNTIENKIIAVLNSVEEIIDKINQIRIENEDYDFSVIGLSDSKKYINDFCDDMELK